MSDLNLEELLVDAAGAAVYPTTPDLRLRVMRTIGGDRRTKRPATRFALGAAAAVAVVAVSAVAVVPSSRDAVADFFGVEGTDVDVRPTASTTPFPTPHDIDSSAEPSSLAALEDTLGKRPGLPAGLTPASVYLVRYGDSPAAILRFDGFDVWEADVSGDFEGILGKTVNSQATLTDTVVNGVPARWISGGPHLVAFYDASGTFVADTERTVERNTLIWRTDAALYRIETRLDIDDAIAIAETLP